MTDYELERRLADGLKTWFVGVGAAATVGAVVGLVTLPVGLADPLAWLAAGWMLGLLTGGAVALWDRRRDIRRREPQP